MEWFEKLVNQSKKSKQTPPSPKPPASDVKAQDLIQVLDSLLLLPYVLVEIVASYWTSKWLEGRCIGVILVDGSNDSCPWSLCTDSKQLYFTDWCNHCILTYTLDGQLCEVFKPTISKGSVTQYLFLSPTGLDIIQGISSTQLVLSDESHFYLIDLTNFPITEKSIILKWPLPEGDFNENIGKGSRCIKFSDNEIYLTLWKSHRIYHCNKSGHLIQCFGRFLPRIGGQSPGEFNKPCGITLDTSSIYICDRDNHRIQIFSKDNNYLSHFGSSTLRLPEGILLYEESLYISDNMSIQLFSKHGILEQKIGGIEGHQRGQFNSPRGICIVNRKLYVADTWNGRIQIFV